jgi:hypothetical protein
MKNFLALFTSTPRSMESSGWNTLTEQVRQEKMQTGVKAWHAWMQAKDKQIVVAGSPLGKTLLVSPAGIGEGHNNICGYVVVAAESQQAASRLFEGHPHFSIFPGEGVEVMECLPVPGAGA